MEYIYLYLYMYVCMYVSFRLYARLQLFGPKVVFKNNGAKNKPHPI
jgi:hypothetical protein